MKRRSSALHQPQPSAAKSGATAPQTPQDTNIQTVKPARRNPAVGIGSGSRGRIVRQGHHEVEYGCNQHSAAHPRGEYRGYSTISRRRKSEYGQVRDLLDGSEPRLMMPASRKGKGRKAKSHYPVPISADLAERLAAMDRSANAPLLTRPGGKPWRRSNQAYPFRRVASACGQDPAEVTMYALRHSSIVRQLLAGVPVRIVAAGHDTSVAMIERNYSRYITDHADALVRGAMLDLMPRDKPKLALIG